MARQSRKRTMRRMRGGNYTTSSWGQAVYGGPGQQQALQGSNVIATKDPESMAMPMAPTKVGGGIVTDVALPAALIFARNSIGTRRFLETPRRSRRNRRRGSRRRR